MILSIPKRHSSFIYRDMMATVNEDPYLGFSPKCLTVCHVSVALTRVRVTILVDVTGTADCVLHLTPGGRIEGYPIEAYYAIKHLKPNPDVRRVEFAPVFGPESGVRVLVERAEYTNLFAR